MSHKNKKPRISNVSNTSLKRKNAEETPSKRPKLEVNKTDELHSLRRKNFIKACEHVSYKSYLNHTERFHLIYLPNCVGVNDCNHHDSKSRIAIKPIPTHVEEMFNIEIKTNMWLEALEVCHLCITPSQYLTANILKNIVEIIMNAHDDITEGHSVSNLIKQCQLILGFNFSSHPPCLARSVRKCYNNFLTSAMDLKKNTFTNRSDFGCDKGIVKYCMNRLEYEISADSKDEPLINKYENIPEDMKQSVKGLHWQKEKLELFELLERPDRIDRLMAVLYSIIELLQFDLAIWHTRYTNNLGCHIMRSYKPLMAFVLWSNNVLYTGAVNNNCRQILRIFAYFIHLKYPEDYIKTMTLWVNTIIQTFYICETNSGSDYPNTGKYCTAFADEFYKLIKELPHDSIRKILERIHPTFMRHLIGMIYIKTLLSTSNDNCIQILINVLNGSEWNQFPNLQDDMLNIKPVNIKNIKPRKFLKLLSNKCKEYQKSPVCNTENQYPKFSQITNKYPVSRNSLFRVLYITFHAYLDAYSVINIQEVLDKMNDQLENGEMDTEDHVKNNSYTVTESFIKTYRQIFQLIKELVIILNNIKEESELSDIKKVIENLLGV